MEQEDVSVADSAGVDRQPLRVDIVTIFPDFFQSNLAVGVVSRALKQGLASVATVDLRSFALDRHRTVTTARSAVAKAWS